LNGIVYDPAGSMPLNNVFVYVPNTKPAPIVPGSPTCSPCQADATGDPITYGTSDAQGWFHLSNVPSGDDVPLVMQVGKWRRQIVVPHIEACGDNTLLDPSLVRLPAKASEGDMPLIALTTGCDAAECFLQSVGVDVSEFTNPEGSGHVHVYAGRYPGMTIPNMGDAYALWASPDRLAKYDVVLGACECAPYPRDTEGPAYDAMAQYLNTGGRFYATHYQSNWFAPPSGPAAFQGVAQWGSGNGVNGATFFVDTSFPKGAAFSQWLNAAALSPEPGEVSISDTRNSVQEVSGATRWIYAAGEATDNAYSSKFLSFNTPIGTPVANQCGRAVFSDVHVSGESNSPGAFPAECVARDDPHAVNQTALEFLFFDLVSCIQDDTQGSQQPPLH
jgi:hypothetical protein